jgi:TPR repeat protein
MRNGIRTQLSQNMEHNRVICTAAEVPLTAWRSYVWLIFVRTFIVFVCVLRVACLASAADGQASSGTPLREMRERAEKGDSEAQFRMGWTYYLGKVVRKDEAESIKWFRMAGDQGLAAAQEKLGHIYRDGDGVPKDQTEALKWFGKAAEQGSPSAQYWLAGVYLEQTPTNLPAALKWARAAAEQNFAPSFNILGTMYKQGEGVQKDLTEALKYFRKAAEFEVAEAQYNLGYLYALGEGVPKDAAEAVKWFRKAAEQGDPDAQNALGAMYSRGEGVPKDAVEAVKWFRMSAQGGCEVGQKNLARCYHEGTGVTKDSVLAYKWFNLAAAGGDADAVKERNSLEIEMTASQVAEAQQLSRGFRPSTNSQPEAVLGRLPKEFADGATPEASASGFFITSDGYLGTNEHVVRTHNRIRILAQEGFLVARVLKTDPANDLALLKVEGRFSFLAVVTSRAIKLGRPVTTVGFPNIGLQGFSPKLAKGEIASLSGAGDDARYFQISVPVQPGNSGGALVDERGNVVGVVSAKLSARAALAASGALPENVNYAVKSSYLLSFLESVPEVAAKLKEPNPKDRKFEDVVKFAEQAAVLVLVY